MYENDIETIKNNFLAACKSLGLNDTDVVVQSYQGWDGNYWWYKNNKKKNIFEYCHKNEKAGHACKRDYEICYRNYQRRN